MFYLSLKFHRCLSQEINSFTAEIRAKPQHHRFLIGRGGANIKKVRESTGARIVFPTLSDDDKELIIIIGKKDGVEAAKQELLKAIKDLVWKAFMHSDYVNKKVPGLSMKVPVRLVFQGR